jgi:hypothetical protein
LNTGDKRKGKSGFLKYVKLPSSCWRITRDNNSRTSIAIIYNLLMELSDLLNVGN